MNLVKSYRIATVAITALVIANLANADPPGRVARLSLAEGKVSFAPARSESDDNWSAAQINWPITGGNRLYADDDARAELQIGASSLRLAEETAIDFTRLDDERVEAYVTQGTIHITLRHWDNNDPFLITTPTLSVTLSGSGRYRIDVDDDGENATVTVRQGEAQVVNGNSRFNLIAPQRAEISGWDGGDVSIERFDDEDDFDRWAADRDRRQEVTYSSRYVEPTTPGLYELDHHGQWRETSDYGHVWTPNNVAADWAPYRHGRWAWVEPWGWTWIDDAPWGYAPSHYGRWVFVDRYWAWAPGHRIARPVYAPALVSFISGPGFSVSINAGGPFGWVPLAPYEAYYPYHHHSDHYVRRINVPHVRHDHVIDRHHRGDYRNRHHPGGLTIVDPRVVIGGLPVPRGVLPVERHLLRDLARAAPPLPPLPRIGGVLPKPVFARPLERERHRERARRDDGWRGNEQKFQTGAPPVAVRQPVQQQEQPVVREQGREWRRDERKRVMPRPDYTIPRHEVDTRVPLPLNAHRPAPIVRQVPVQPAAPVVREIRRDHAAPVVRERPHFAPRDFRHEQRAAPVQRSEPKRATTGGGKSHGTPMGRKINEGMIRAR